VLSFAGKVAVRGDSKARVRRELYRSASGLPGDLEKGCNEMRLLHGSQPDLVWSIVQQGLNERFAGASAGTTFGDGSYFADDAGKIDQYVVEDKRYNAAKALHQQLYSDSSSHPGSVFYALVFRVTLGHSVKYAKIGEEEPCFRIPNQRGVSCKTSQTLKHHTTPWWPPTYATTTSTSSFTLLRHIPNMCWHFNVVEWWFHIEGTAFLQGYI